MVKAMYSGVSGLKAHQSKMDVIGNNIANVNTWGYKSMDTSFKESIYSLVNSGSTGSTANGGFGGTNPSVVGYGSMVSAITANFTSGNQVPTGKNLDVYIDGTAFFAVGPMYGEGEAKAPGDIYLSRVGDFSVVNGYLVDSNGRYVYGSSMSTGGEIYNPTATSKTTDKEINRDIPTVFPGYPKTDYAANGRVTYTVYNNVDADGDALDVGNMNKYVYKANHSESRVPDPAVDKDKDLQDLIDGGLSLQAAVDKYNEDHVGGAYNYTVDKDDPTKIVKLKKNDSLSEIDVEIPLPEPKVGQPDADGITTTVSYKESDVPGKMIEITTVVTPADPDAVKKGPQFDDGRLTFKDGSYTMGDVGTLKPLKIPTSCTYYDETGKASTEENITFSSFTIQQDGMIYGTSASSKKTYLVGCVGLVNVSNPGGMNKADGPYYQLGGSSGEGKIIQPGGATGKLTSGYLESANVDIATEFSSMITTQRGFQANSKIITVTDEMLQELVNMKR